MEQKKNREKMLLNQSSPRSSSKSFASSSSSSINTNWSYDQNKNKKKKKKNKKNEPKFVIEMNRLISIPLDSNICYTLSFHPNCRYIATCITNKCFIFEIDFNAEYPAYHEIKVAKKYLSGAKFIGDVHIMFGSGDGNVYIYNFVDERLVATISDKPNKKNNDVLCFDHAVLNCLDQYFGKTGKQIVAFATLDGNILIYDISKIMKNEKKNDIDIDKQKKVNATLLQRMEYQFGAEISCLSISGDGRFIVVGSEDNTFNIYCISVLRRNEGSKRFVNVQWVLLSKQFVYNDQNINRLKWINDTTLIGSCDEGKDLYLSGIYNIGQSQTIVDLLIDIITPYNMIRKCDCCNCYVKMFELSEYTMHYMVAIILEYVMWIPLHYRTSVDFKEQISCIATCSEANGGAGLVVVGGFANSLQCFLPLKSNIL